MLVGLQVDTGRNRHIPSDWTVKPVSLHGVWFWSKSPSEQELGKGDEQCLLTARNRLRISYPSRAGLK